MSLDLALWVTAIGTEVVLVTLLFRGRVFRTLPVFCLYLIWVILSDVAMMEISRQFQNRYFQAFLIEMPLDSVFQFCVLLELTWSLFRPSRASLSRRAILVLAGVILLAGAGVWPIAGALVLPGYSPQWHLLFQLQQTFSMLRVLVFLALAGLSQLLAIGWRDRELQIATGLGLYSLVSLGAAEFHTHPASPGLYHAVDQIVMASYLCSLIYWVISFVQKEVARQEFSPRMQNILLSVAGTARASRMTMDEIRKSKP